MEQISISITRMMSHNNSSNKISFIYALVCPIIKEIRYIGKTDNLCSRYSYHLTTGLKYYPREYKYCWIKSLLNKGLKPDIIIIEGCDSSIWEDREKYWIEYFRGKGCKLTNLTDGGEGQKTGFEFDSLAKEKISIASKKWKRTDICKRKISNANRGSKNGVAILSEEKVKDILYKINSGNRVYDLAREYNMSYSVISNIKFNRAWKHVPRV